MFTDEKYVFPDGRVAVLVTYVSDAGTHRREFVSWEDLAGNLLGWGKVEHVPYASTLGEQYLAQRSVAAP